MDGPCGQLLSCAGFPGNQDGRWAVGNAADQPQHGFGGRARTDDAAEKAGIVLRSAQVAVHADQNGRRLAVLKHRPGCQPGSHVPKAGRLFKQMVAAGDPADNGGREHLPERGAGNVAHLKEAGSRLVIPENDPVGIC